MQRTSTLRIQTGVSQCISYWYLELSNCSIEYYSWAGIGLIIINYTILGTNQGIGDTDGAIWKELENNESIRLPDDNIYKRWCKHYCHPRDTRCMFGWCKMLIIRC